MLCTCNNALYSCSNFLHIITSELGVWMVDCMLVAFPWASWFRFKLIVMFLWFRLLAVRVEDCVALELEYLTLLVFASCWGDFVVAFVVSF